MPGWYKRLGDAWEHLATERPMSLPGLASRVHQELFPPEGPPVTLTQLGEEQYSGRPVEALMDAAAFGPGAVSPTFREQATAVGQLPMGGMTAWKARGVPATKALKRELETAVVGSSGKPARVYHGTTETFDKPRISLKWWERNSEPLYGAGHYTTENPTVASGYATERTGANVRPSYLSIKKPFDVDRDRLNIKYLRPDEVDKVYPNPGEAAYESRLKTRTLSWDELSHKFGKEWTNRILMDAGYDGLTHTGGQISGGVPHRVWIAFDPEQVIPALSSEGEKFYKRVSEAAR